MKSAEANMNERDAMTQRVGSCQRLTAMSSCVCWSGSCWFPAPARKPDLKRENQGQKRIMLVSGASLLTDPAIFRGSKSGSMADEMASCSS